MFQNISARSRTAKTRIIKRKTYAKHVKTFLLLFACSHGNRV